VPNGEYFLTLCTDEHRHGLTNVGIASAVLREMQEMILDGSWQVRCATVMPDHVHALVVLGGRLSLGKTVARLKAKTSRGLADSACKWERDFFDRHVRPDEDRLALFLYIFLNPYRAGLSSRLETWPWYFCRPDDWEWFQNYLEQDRPLPEWLL
jgi:REP element-mobilizing transposase RayT